MSDTDTRRRRRGRLAEAVAGAAQEAAHTLSDSPALAGVRAIGSALLVALIALAVAVLALAAVSVQRFST